MAAFAKCLARVHIQAGQVSGRLTSSRRYPDEGSISLHHRSGEVLTSMVRILCSGARPGALCSAGREHRGRALPHPHLLPHGLCGVPHHRHPGDHHEAPPTGVFPLQHMVFLADQTRDFYGSSRCALRSTSMSSPPPLLSSASSSSPTARPPIQTHAS